MQDRTLTGLHRTVRCTQYMHVYCKYSFTCGCVNVCVYMCSLTHGGCSTVLLIWTNACAGTTALFSLWERQRGTERETLVLNSVDYLNRYIKTWKGSWRIEANIISVCVCVTLSEKTQLKSFLCDLLFSTKKIILHMVKNILWKCNLYIFILTEYSHVKLKL